MFFKVDLYGTPYLSKLSLDRSLRFCRLIQSFEQFMCSSTSFAVECRSVVVSGINKRCLCFLSFNKYISV